ncbi:MAG: DUF305 domain-containing protein [Candidatus Levybacteria bacterium]|nr:DUF305 domain-containing protein [Candidatus Levybacteria bacterium]
MKTEYLYAIIGFLAGIVITVIFANNAVNSNNMGMMGMMGMRQMVNNQDLFSQGMSQMHDQMMGEDEMSMSGMVNALEGKTGDDFDKAFIEQMIPHHRGAIEMAKLAQQNASHDEIKNLADDIIKAQTSEINMMTEWQKSWGY